MFFSKIVILALLACVVKINGQSYEDDLKFYIYPATGPRLNFTNTTTAVKLGCNPKAPWAFIVHGWLAGTNGSEWFTDIVSNLTKYRGGCILAIDYSIYATNINYFDIMGKFEDICKVFLNKLQKFLGEGFLPENGYMFGFSYGVQMIYSVGTSLGGKIARIDVCEPASLGFDGTSRWMDPKKAGKNVQCIHTSIDAGTTSRECHQDWIMGYCGTGQPAGGLPPKTNHGICPHFYNSAFKNSFYAEPRPFFCVVFTGNVTKSYPTKLRMGYMDAARLSKVRGSLFSPTYNSITYAYPK